MSVMRALLCFSLAGGVLLYLLGIFTWRGDLTPPFFVLSASIMTMSIPWIGSILLVNSTFGKEFPMNRSDSLRRVLGFAPAWSKVLVAVAFVLSYGTLFYSTGGGLSISDWSAALPWQRAVFFIATAPMWFVPVPLLKALERHAAFYEDDPVKPSTRDAGGR